MAKLYSPDPVFSGICAGIQFDGGVAECSDPFVLGWLSAHGFGVSYDESSADSDNDPYIFPLVEPLEKYSEETLLAFARSAEISVGGINSKPALIERIRAFTGGNGA